MTATLPTILVVDDEEAILRLLAKILQQVGVVHTVNSGAEGLLFLQSELVDLIISDQSMPGMTGAQLLAVVARRWPATERVLMSGYCDPDVVAQGLHSGVIGYFACKPLDRAARREIQERARSAHHRRITLHEINNTTIGPRPVMNNVSLELCE